EHLQLQHPRVVDVHRDVLQVFSQPPAHDRDGEQVAVRSIEGDGADDRDEALHQASAERRHEDAERREDHVAGFVEHQIDDMEERAADDRLLERMRQEAPGPPGEEQEERYASGPRQHLDHHLLFLSAFVTNVSMSDAGRAPAARAISRPFLKTAMVGMDRMPSRSPTAATSSVFSFTTRSRPAVRAATFSTSGATIRHGPHHGAQKSTTTGIAEEAIRPSNSDAVVTSTGEPMLGSSVLNLPHCVFSGRRA